MTRCTSAALRPSGRHYVTMLSEAMLAEVATRFWPICVNKLASSVDTCLPEAFKPILAKGTTNCLAGLWKHADV